MSELPPPTPDQIPVDLPPPVSNVQLLGAETSAIFEPQQKVLGSVVLSTEVNIDNLDIEDPDRTLTREEINSLKSQQIDNDSTESDLHVNSKLVQETSEIIAVDKEPKRVLNEIYAVTDHFIERANRIQNGGNGFGGALEAISAIRSRLYNLDTRELNDPERQVETRRLIIKAQEIMNSAFNEESGLSSDIQESQGEDGQLTTTITAMEGLGAHEVASDAPELETQLIETGGHFLNAVGNLNDASRNMQVNSGIDQKNETNNLLVRLTDLLMSGNLHPNDIEFATSALRQITVIIEAQQTNLQAVKSRTEQIPQIANRIFKILESNTQ